MNNLSLFTPLKSLEYEFANYASFDFNALVVCNSTIMEKCVSIANDEGGECAIINIASNII